MKPPCERNCPSRTVGCHAKRELYLEYEEAKQAEYREREIERSCDAYTENAKKRCKSVERLRKAGLL
mgnify:CR=1 FL=1